MTYAYDGDGNLKQRSDSTVITEYDFDPLSRETVRPSRTALRPCSPIRPTGTSRRTRPHPEPSATPTARPTV
ncbi:hypothetical protein ACFWY6_26985 [Streptomyces sp. NPDC059037]|uniref:hypothetical protein n=1 Tax=Streptomyces sp. NPDC059037 TaxID=3346710 RepID=UPI003687D00C